MEVNGNVGRTIEDMYDEEEPAVPHSAGAETTEDANIIMGLGDPVKAFDLSNPVGEREHQEATDVKRLIDLKPAWLRLRKKDSYSKESKYVAKMEKRMVSLAEALDNGCNWKEALTTSGAVMKGRVLAPVTEKRIKEFFVAHGKSRVNLEQGIVKRHFTSTDDVILSEADQQHIANSAYVFGKKLWAEVPAELTHIDIQTMLPKKFSDEQAMKVLKSLTGKLNLDESKSYLDAVRKIFVKPNECLKKMRARCIIAPRSDDLTLAHQIDAGLVERVVFKDPVFKSRSIKYATTTMLNCRVHKMAKKFEDGGVISIDFGSWDSRIRADIRNMVENRVVEGFLAEMDDGGGVAKEAYADRVRDILKMTSPWYNIEAAEFGRQSGDRGTSIFNYLTNLFMVYLVYRHLERFHRGVDLSFEEFYDKMKKGTALVDFLAEGDDLLLFIDKTFLGEGRKEASWRIIRSIYSAAAFVLEPQVEGGRVVDVKVNSSIECIKRPAERMEFISRLFIHRREGTVCMPKLGKAINAIYCTFSQEKDIYNVLYSTSLSGLVNHGALPMLREYWTSMKCIAEKGEGKFTATTYYDKKLQWGAQDCQMEVNDYVKDQCRKVREVADDELMRLVLEKEHPRLTIDVQEQIENIFKSVHEYPVEEAWRRVAVGVTMIMDNM